MFKNILKIISLIMFMHMSMIALSQESDSVKCWSEADKLKWSDFMGKIPDNATSLRQHAITIYSLTPIPFKRNGVLNYRINLVFLKYESWKTETSDSTRAKHLLAHEQLHFDIGELYARKLRKAIKIVSETIPNPNTQDFRTVFQKLFNENVAMQSEYDSDTAHGIIQASQVEWQNKIHRELAQLKEYESTSADCE